MQRTTSKIERVRIVFFILVFLISFGILFQLPRISVPIAISFILNLIFSPLIPRLVKMGLSRTIATWSIFIGIMFFSVYPVVKVAPMITQETQNFQYYIPKVERFIENKYREVRVQIKEKTGYTIEDKYVVDGFNYVRTTTASFLLNLPKTLANLIEWIFVVPLFVFFMLKDGHRIKSLILKITPNSIFERFYFLSHQFNKKLGDYIFAKIVEATIVGLVITLGLLMLDVRFALLFGLIAAITNVIPYLGPVLGSVPALVFGVVDYGMGTTFGAMCILYIIANAIDIAIVFPILVSKIVDLHPIIVVLSVIIGSQAFGILGMVISIPLAAALKLICSEIYAEIYQNRYR